MNKTTHYFLLLFVSILLPTSLLSQTLDWAGSYGGIGEDVVRDFHVDDNGNTYSTGYFTDTADFDFSPIEANLTSNGFFDVYVLKTDNTGAYEWAVSFGGDLFEYGVGITTDASGNVYVTGAFDQTVDFDPGAGEFNLTSEGSGDIFVLKLNPDGEFVWAKSIGGTAYEETTDIAVTPSGTVVLLGYFREELDFDPGAGEFNLTSAGGSDTFLTYLDDNGNFLNATRYGGPQSDLGLAMVINDFGGIFITGDFEGTADFNPSPNEELMLTSSTEGKSAYMLHLNNAGNFFSAGVTQGGNAQANGIALDNNDNVYIAGSFGFTVNFNFNGSTDNNVYTSDQAYNGYVMKINPFGSVEWVKQTESDDTVFNYDVTTNSAGDVFTVGYFADVADFNPDPDAEFMLSKQSANATDAFLSVLDTNGNFKNAYTYGGADFIDTHEVGSDANGNIYMAAQFESTVDLNPLPNEDLETTAIDFRDSYIIKLAPEQLSVPSQIANTIGAYPNPTEGLLYISNVDPLQGDVYNVFDVSGRKVLSGTIESSNSINLRQLNTGLYYLNIAGKETLEVIRN